jgi:imidazolonepropionase-like amidohydrolase
MDYFPQGMTHYFDSTLLDNAALLRLKARAAAGELWSPRIYTSGKWYTDSTKSVSENLAAYKAAGFDHLKLYQEMDDTVQVESLAVAARRLGMPIVGHGQYGVTRSIALGYKSFEHLVPYFTDNTDSDWRADSLRLPELVAMTVRAGVWNDICVLLPYQGTYPSKLEERYRNLENALLAGQPPTEEKMPVGKVEEGWRSTMRHYDYVMKTLQDSGARLLTGTDMPLLGIQPGSLTHRNLQAFVRAGLTPYQALVIATRNAAAYLGIADSVGTIAPGKRADLVLLDGNPLQDIRHVGDVAGVMIGGRWMAWADIEQRLEAYYAKVPRP